MSPGLAILTLGLAVWCQFPAPTDAADKLSCVAKLSSCSCRLADGRVIDLAPVQGYPGPVFTLAAPDGYTYQYNPCGAYNCGPGESDSAVCQEKLVIITQYVDFGLQSSAQFDNDPATDGLRLRYLSRDMTKSALINLVCDPSAAVAIFSSDGAQQGGSQLVADLRSRYACPAVPGCGGGMSGGDILLIVCFALLAAYLLGGVLYNRFRRMETGLQMLPNLAFWSSLPGLVADGSAFAYGKCRDMVYRVRGGGYTDIK